MRTNCLKLASLDKKTSTLQIFLMCVCVCVCVCDIARILTFLKEAINDDDYDDDDDDSDDDDGFSLHSMVIPFRIHIYLVKN